ncbi:MAG TPA: hypothetical protein PKK26_16810 [Candidatus Wallbacteria bacterium]|nr:hypothetical protein [Candidatus Wallbacteria bacterium]
MKIEIVGDPAEQIFDILRTTDKISNLRCYSGRINITLNDNISADALKSIKQSIIYNLSGVVKKYMMKIVL